MIAGAVLQKIHFLTKLSRTKTNMKNIKPILIEALENHESRLGKTFGSILVLLIVISVGAFLLENIEYFAPWKPILHLIDIIILSIFAVEYVLRFIIARRKWKFVFSFLGIIDLLVVMPLFTHVFNIAFLRGFRMLKILYLLKTIRQSHLMLSFFHSFRLYKQELRIFCMTLFAVLLMSSMAIFAFEHGVNPDFDTMINSLWWSIVTITNVGYGDIVPITIMGKVVGAGVMLMGLATVALMTAILTKIFIDHFFGKRLHTCAFCHFPHHDHDAKFCKNCGAELDIKELRKAETIIPARNGKK
jgi:voltage-gated potassium channel